MKIVRKVLILTSNVIIILLNICICFISDCEGYQNRPRVFSCGAVETSTAGIGTGLYIIFGSLNIILGSLNIILGSLNIILGSLNIILGILHNFTVHHDESLVQVWVIDRDLLPGFAAEIVDVEEEDCEEDTGGEEREREGEENATI